MNRWYLIRHAQTSWNRDNRLQGHSDLPLSELGLQQAACLGRAFAGRHLDAVFTSHLSRSRQTADAITQGNGHQIQPVVEQALAEMHLGSWEGLTPDEIDAQFQDAYQQWRHSPSSVVIPGAEALEGFRGRVRQAFNGLVEQRGAGQHVIVSHGGVIASILADLLGADYDRVIRRMRLDNAGISAVEFGVGAPHVLWINSTLHLADADAGAGGWY
jgi:broad specificity phosphatase PhoE